MKAHTASLINAITLIVCSAWAYLAVSGGHWTPLIPGIVGVALIACYSGVKAENKVIAHIAVLLTAMILIALFMPLRSAFQSGDVLAMVRAVLMIATTAFALFAFIQSFRAARKARA
ncbi:MAG: hypothetical protein AAF619_01285 [Pseudomonadota bacterium]